MQLFVLLYVALRALASTWAAWLPALTSVTVAVIALLGVAWTANRNLQATLRAEALKATNAIAAEDRRAENQQRHELRNIGREGALEAVFQVAETVKSLKKFNSTMSGNTGKGKQDRQSAHAISDWIARFEGIDPLQQQSLRVRALGSQQVADAIDAVRNRMFEYVMSLEPPVFKGAHAVEVEADLDQLMALLIAAVRHDLGTDDAWKR